MMTATGDNFFTAFAIYLQASAVQMGWLMAIRQLFGALFQRLSAWLGNYLPRKPMVVVTTTVQAVVVLLSVLALDWLNGIGISQFIVYRVRCQFRFTSHGCALVLDPRSGAQTASSPQIFAADISCVALQRRCRGIIGLVECDTARQSRPGAGV